MAFDMLGTLTNALFFIFTHVFALGRGIAVAELPWYSIVVGLTMVVGRLTASRLLDRGRRGIALLIGASLAAAGLLTAALAAEIGTLIDFGFPAPFLVGLVSPIAIASLVLANWADLGRTIRPARSAAGQAG